jgi:hypothetical protein
LVLKKFEKMASTIGQAQALILYYAREKLYRHLCNVCTDFEKKKGDDPVTTYWKAFGVMSEGIVLNEIIER